MHLALPLLEGELWWSAIARHFELTGVTRPGVQSRVLVGNRRSTGSPSFPRQVSLAATRLGVSLNPSDILQQHTLLPIYSAFLDATRVTVAKATMLLNGHAEFHLGIATMRDYPRWLRACPICAEQDRKSFGCVPWRTIHQLPGVTVCPIHFVDLLESSVSARAATQIREYQTASQSEVLVKCRHPKITCDNDQRWLAQSAKDLLSWRGPFPGQNRLASFYRLRLQQLGYLDRHNRIAATRLTGDFNQRLSRLVNRIGHSLPCPSDRTNWLMRLLRPNQSTLSPACHLAMLRFIEVKPLSAVEEAAKLAPAELIRRQPFVAAVRTKRITNSQVNDHRARWSLALSNDMVCGLRKRHDSLYSWLWRNDRGWLRKSRRG